MSGESSDAQSGPPPPSPSPPRWTAASLPQSTSYSGGAAGPLQYLAEGCLTARSSLRPSGFNPNAAPFHPIVRSETDDGVEGSRMSGWNNDGQSGSPTCSLSPQRWSTPYCSSTAKQLLYGGANVPLQDLGRRQLLSGFNPYTAQFQPLSSFIPSFAVPVGDGKFGNPLPPSPPSPATSSRPSVRPAAKFQDVGGSDARLSHSSSRPPRPTPTHPSLAGHDSPLELNYPELAPRFLLPAKLPALEEDVLIMDGEMVFVDFNNASSSHRTKHRPATRSSGQRSILQPTSRGTGAFLPRAHSRSRSSNATTTSPAAAAAAGENDKGMAAKTMVAFPANPWSTTPSFRWPPPDAEGDTEIMQVLYGPSKNQRLRVFNEICPV